MGFCRRLLRRLGRSRILSTERWPWRPALLRWLHSGTTRRDAVVAPPSTQMVQVSGAAKALNVRFRPKADSSRKGVSPSYFHSERPSLVRNIVCEGFARTAKSERGRRPFELASSTRDGGRAGSGRKPVANISLRIENLAHFRCQTVKSKWLRYELHAVVQPSIMDNRVPCVPGGE